MTGPTCPAEGCDYNEDGTKDAASVRRHMNAKADDAHGDLEALRAALMEQQSTADQGDEGDDDPPGTGGAAADEGDDGDEQGEAVEEGAESGTEAENEHPDEGDEMDQSTEYENQLQQQSGESGSENSDGSGPDEGNDRAQSGASSGGSGPSGLAILAGTVVIGLAFLLATGSGDDEQGPIEVESTAADADETADEPVRTWE